MQHDPGGGTAQVEPPLQEAVREQSSSATEAAGPRETTGDSPTEPSQVDASSKEATSSPSQATAALVPINDLHSPAQLQEYLSRHKVEVLVAFESEGGMRDAMTAIGRSAMSAANRPSQTAGVHYFGDVRQAVAAQKWSIIAFVGPNCYNGLKKDHYLPNKIQDGRAWWQMRMVQWCITSNQCNALMVEQPDTLAHSFLPYDEMPGVQVDEFYTSQYVNDQSVQVKDKFIRLTTRNLKWERPRFERAQKRQPRPLHWSYATKEDRDIDRSSFAHYPEMCKALAKCEPVEESCQEIDSRKVIEKMAGAWRKAGYPLPPEYDNIDAQPSDLEAREYTYRRGDGKQPAWVGALAREWSAVEGAPREGSEVNQEEPTRSPPTTPAPPVPCDPDPPQERLLEPVDRMEYQEARQRAEDGEATLGDEVTLSHAVSRGVQGEVDAGAPPEQLRGEVDAKAAARMAEPGDQQVVTDKLEALRKLVLRKQKHGAEPTAEQREAIMRLSTKPESELKSSDVVVVPISVQSEGVLVYLPTEPGAVLTAKDDSAKGGTVQAAETATASWLPELMPCFGFRSGARHDGGKIVTVPTHQKPSPESVVRDSKGRASKKGAGALAIWCMLSALTVMDPISRLAGACVAQFTAHDGATTGWLQQEMMLRESQGHQGGVGGLNAVEVAAFGEGGQVTPRQLVARAAQGMHDLRSDIATNRPELRGWSECMEPLRIEEVPQELWDKPLEVGARVLNEQLFSEPLPVYELPWLERQPAQLYAPPPGCEDYNPRSTADLVDAAAWEQWERWQEQARKDNQCLEERGANCDRADRPDNLVLGQSDTHHCAYGYVWDCRGGAGCSLLDYEAPISTRFNLPWLRVKLKDYPDQRLASNILEGVRLEADLPYQLVAAPHLTSVGEGYQSVQKTARELLKEGFYEFHRSAPFYPMIVVGSGSREKKLQAPGQPKKYRRTSNFSGPHGDVKDRDGVKVVPVNSASKCYHVPQWLAEANNLKVRKWAWQKYEHVPEQVQATTVEKPRLKFPREYKPQLVDVMKDMTILLGASLDLEEPMFTFVWDAAFYFNQFGYAPEEYFKSNLVVAAKAGDVDRERVQMTKHSLVYVTELRLGFGSYASSNIAQRFSNALVGWVMEEFDRRQELTLASEPAQSKWRSWIERRRRLEAKCLLERPKRKGNARSDCTQTRLAAMHMFTDDPVAIIVGRHRAMEFLASLQHVIDQIGLVMAEEEKRQGGAGVEWVGVWLLAGIGLVIVPMAKLLRARDALKGAIAGELQFCDYRALVGLLEHLRFIARLKSDATNPLYAPHSKGGEGEKGPNEIVRPTALMTEALLAWQKVIMQCAGALVSMAFTTKASEMIQQTHKIYAGSADAAGDGEGTPGLGGWLHGHYWRVNLTAMLVQAMHITAWETLATVINNLVAQRLADDDAIIYNRADAALTPTVLTTLKSKSKMVQIIINKAMKLDRYQALLRRLVISHWAGDGNVLSDLDSRALWEPFHRACATLRVKPVYVRLEEDERELVRLVTEEAVKHAGLSGVDADIAAMHDPPNHELRLYKPRGWTSTTMVLEQRAGHESDEHGKEETSPPKRPRAGHSEPTALPAPRRPRKMTKEQHRGGDFSSTTDKDGPFVPSWAKAAQPCAADRTATSIDRRPRYTPSWSRHEETLPKLAGKVQAAPTPKRHKVSITAKQVYGEPLPQEPMERDNLTKRAHALAHRLAADRSEGRINADATTIKEVALAIEHAKQDGRNPRTMRKDRLSFQRFQVFAQLNGFDPNLKTKWSETFPERELWKLCGFMLFLAVRTQPRSKKANACKPMTHYQSYLALRRYFQYEGVTLPPSTQVRKVLRGMINRFKKREGITNLRAKQAEPITPKMVSAMIDSAKRGTVIGTKPWRLDNDECFSVVAWMAVNLTCGTRKAESVRLEGDEDEDDWFTLDALAWKINGRVIEEPTDEQLESITNTDMAMLSPKGSKCDTWGTAHGTEPIVLPYRNDDLNAAFWLKKIEKRNRGKDRRSTALFGKQDGQPFTASQFDAHVKRALTHQFGTTIAALYSPHSWRVWVSTALRARNAPPGIQLMMLRWLNPDSIKIYARASVTEKIHWVDEIFKVHSIDAARTTTINAVAGTDVMAAYDRGLVERRQNRKSPTDLFDESVEREMREPDKPTLKKGDRISVYWTEMDEWYTATHLSTRKTTTADGDTLYESHVKYDAVGVWQKAKDLVHWHCLNDEQWHNI